VGVPSSATVLDLGAGTGKFTRLLVSTFVRVVAVEPDDEMRRLLTTLCSEAEALAGSAEQIPGVDASVDAVFAAQCRYASGEWMAGAFVVKRMEATSRRAFPAAEVKSLLASNESKNATRPSRGSASPACTFR